MITLTNRTVFCRFKDGGCDDWGDSKGTVHDGSTDVWEENSDGERMVELSVSEAFGVVKELAAETSSHCRSTGKLTTSCS